MTAIRHKGPWSPEATLAFLEEVRIPVRLACNGAAGHPVIASLWFLPEADRFWCATQRGAAIAGLIDKDPRCSFEVSLESPPYRGIRGAANAHLRDERGEEVLRALIDRYVPGNPRLEALLLANVSTETAIEVVPESIVSWDFRERMGSGQ